jgi:antibiotic biosynthesis monooxygenase (ABM) superfamily enzyme
MEPRIEYIKAAPPVTISTISLLGIPLNEWVFISTIGYTILLTIFLIRDKLVYPWLERRRALKRANHGDR